MKKILSLIVCSVCCGVAVAQTYSLQQLKDSALHNNIAIRNARHSVDAAQQQQALSRYLFHLFTAFRQLCILFPNHFCKCSVLLHEFLQRGR